MLHQIYLKVNFFFRPFGCFRFTSRFFLDYVKMVYNLAVICSAVDCMTVIETKNIHNLSLKNDFGPCGLYGA